MTQIVYSQTIPSMLQRYMPSVHKCFLAKKKICLVCFKQYHLGNKNIKTLKLAELLRKRSGLIPLEICQLFLKFDHLGNNQSILNFTLSTVCLYIQ